MRVADERSISEPLELALQREGFDVSLAEAAAPALEEFQARQLRQVEQLELK